MIRQKKIFLFFCISLISFCFCNTNEKTYSLIEKRVKQINALSILIPDSPTGVIDAKGNYIQQDDNSFGLCCAGYAKWIADGFYFPLRKQNHTTLRYMSIQELNKTNLRIRGNLETLNYEKSRQPFFGLDWTRNIATVLATEKEHRVFYPTDHDVTQSIYAKYTKDRGFPIELIPEIMKEQSILHPNRWYLVSISGPFGDNPILLQHYHTAVFFPYFTKNYHFKLAVLERTRQTSFEYLLSRYQNTYCHLVWAEIEGKFELTLP